MPLPSSWRQVYELEQAVKAPLSMLMKCLSPNGLVVFISDYTCIFLLIKTEKSLLLGFQILLVKIHLNGAQCLWGAHRTEKAVTHGGGLLKNSAFL